MNAQNSMTFDKWFTAVPTPKTKAASTMVQTMYRIIRTTLSGSSANQLVSDARLLNQRKP